MGENLEIKDVVEEIKGADEETLRNTVEKWFESTRTSGMKIGAKYMSIAIFETIKKHTKKSAKVSLRDYERMTAEIIKIISVQLTEQNDSEENIVKENEDDGTAETNDNTNS